MTYSFDFTGIDGADYSLYGYKVIYDDPGIDMFSDMTTLFTKVYKGDLMDDQVVGAGILQFRMRDLLSMLASFKVTNTYSPITKVKTIRQFYLFCYGEVRNSHLDKLSPVYHTAYENLVLNAKVVWSRISRNTSQDGSPMTLRDGITN